MTTPPARIANHPINSLFLDRWSPRAFTGETISEAELASLFEAARWAPSSFNSQPWRFIYARKDGPHWDKFLGLLIEFNRSWASQAAALVFMVSREKFLPPGASEEIVSHSHSFDAGAAWASLAFQAKFSGWDSHAMAGFDLPQSYQVLGVPPGYRVEAAVAIGRRGDPSLLPEKVAAREYPSDRRPLTELAFEGGFPAKF